MLCARSRASTSTAYPEHTKAIPSEAELREYVAEIVAAHPEFSRVSKWRVVVTSTIEALDTRVQGDELPPAAQLHDDIMEKLRNL